MRSHLTKPQIQIRLNPLSKKGKGVTLSNNGRVTPFNVPRTYLLKGQS